jgi:hypothetical protein
MHYDDPYLRLEEAEHVTAWREQYRSQVYQKARKRARRINFAFWTTYIIAMSLFLYWLFFVLF